MYDTNRAIGEYIEYIGRRKKAGELNSLCLGWAQWSRQPAQGPPRRFSTSVVTREHEVNFVRVSVWTICSASLHTVKS